MPWVTPVTTVEAELAGEGAGWTPITDDVTNDPIVLSYGIKSHRPEIRVAESGYIQFTMRNDANNSASTLGYYSPHSASKRAGWRQGIRVRTKQVYSGNTRYYMGWLDDAVVEPGQFEGRRVFCKALDWMNEAAKTNAPTAIQANKRSDQVFSAVLANVAKQPAATSIDTGRDTFVYALDNVQSETKVMSVFADLAKSELGNIYVKRDATVGQTLTFESRTARSIVGSVLVTLDNTMHGLALPSGRADIMNVFRLISHPRATDASIVVAKIDATITTPIRPGETKTWFLDYTHPVQRDTKIGATNYVTPLVANTDFVINSAEDGSGSDLSASFTVTPTFFSSAVKMVVTNNGSVSGYVRVLQARGDGIYALNPVTAEARDATSVTDYGENVVTVDMLYQSNPGVAHDAALYLKEIWKNPLANAKQVRFVANQSDALMVAAITGDISHRVAIVETVSGLTASTQYFINAVEHHIDEMEKLTCSWWLTPASTTVYWQLGVTLACELDSGTRLGY